MPRDISECVDLFERLPEELQLKLLRREGRRSAEIIRAAQSKGAPVDTGHLSRNIVIKTRKETDTEIRIDVGPARSAYYGVFEEFGTAFVTKKPWMEPATEQSFPEASESFADGVRRAIEKHFK